ncbi:WD repeat and SOCS box-containing protein 1 [Exaiptasia diaphana]|nr:WD repeat and SOCS box-containing protein 1 [Exaiptasia diaphana]
MTKSVLGVTIEQSHNQCSDDTRNDSSSTKNERFKLFKRCWDLSSQNTTTVARHSTITSGPWSVASNGKYICSQAMKLWREEDVFISRGDDVESDAVCCGFEGIVNEFRKLYPQTCPFSPDGTKVACTFESNNNGLQLAILHPSSMDIIHIIKASKECKGIKGTVASMTFSPDSAYLAVVSSKGQVYILRSSGLKLRHALNSEQVIYPLETLDPSINEPSSLEFDPRYDNKVFATCTFYRSLVKIWAVVKNEQRTCIATLYSIHFPRVVNVIKYSTEGDVLAVGCNEGVITCINTNDGTAVFDLNTTNQSPEFRSNAGIYHLSFSRTSEQLAASYSDGHIRVWQIPSDINLQHSCRVVINASVPESKVMQLPLPNKLKRYLLYKCF